MKLPRTGNSTRGLGGTGGWSLSLVLSFRTHPWARSGAADFSIFYPSFCNDFTLVDAFHSEPTLFFMDLHRSVSLIRTYELFFEPPFFIDKSRSSSSRPPSSGVA